MTTSYDHWLTSEPDDSCPSCHTSHEDGPCTDPTWDEREVEEGCDEEACEKEEQRQMGGDQ